MPVRLPARLADRLDRVERRLGALDPRHLPLHQLRRGTLAPLLDALGKLALQPLGVGAGAVEVGVGAIRLGHEVEQVEGPLRGLRQVGGDRRDDAARGPRDAEHRLRAQGAVRVALRRAFLEADRPAQILRVADLDRARVAERLLDQRLGDRCRLAARREVDRLEQRILTLPGQGLDEPGHCPAHRRGRAGGVVAVPTPEAGARDQEGALGADPLPQAAHRDRQQLHPPA